jgi:hypothetical protein
VLLMWVLIPKMLNYSQFASKAYKAEYSSNIYLKNSEIMS